MEMVPCLPRSTGPLRLLSSPLVDASAPTGRSKAWVRRELTWESVLVAATLLRDHPRQQVTYFGLAIPAMSAKSPDRAQLAGLGPPGDRLRVNPEHGRNFCRREQRFGLRWPRIHSGPPSQLFLRRCPKGSEHLITSVTSLRVKGRSKL